MPLAELLVETPKETLKSMKIGKVAKNPSPLSALAPFRRPSPRVWFVASPPEFVLTEGIIVPIEEGLP